MCSSLLFVVDRCLCLLFTVCCLKFVVCWWLLLVFWCLWLFVVVVVCRRCCSLSLFVCFALLLIVDVFVVRCFGVCCLSRGVCLLLVGC